jgi:DNA-binding NarL/FixJ family response regulator
MKKIKILITEDHALLRTIWAKYLSTDPQLAIVAQAATIEECVHLCLEHKPDIVLLDINLAGSNGMEAIAPIRRYSPGSRVIGVSVHTQPSYIREMIRKGASGYLTKNASAEELFESIKVVSAGQKYFCVETSQILASQIAAETTKEAPRDINSLSKRELQIVEYIKQGYSSIHIAEVLHISQKTVEVHRYNILNKLNLPNTASLVNFVNQNYIAIADKNPRLNVIALSRR